MGQVTIRRIMFSGCLNFRDVGGYPTSSGGVTVWGLVYRSDSLHHLSESDLDAFDSLGVSAIYDLRRHREINERPGPRPFMHLELASRTLSGTDPATLRTRADGEQWLFEDYLGMLENATSAFARLFTDLARHDGGAVVFHCWGGKDRTGVTSALLLSALGVDRDTVLDDYELTSTSRGYQHTPDVVDMFMGTGIARPAAEALLSTPRWAMAKALRHLDERHGGVQQYLLDRFGIGPEVLDALRARLTAKTLFTHS